MYTKDIMKDKGYYHYLVSDTHKKYYVLLAVLFLILVLFLSIYTLSLIEPRHEAEKPTPAALSERQQLVLGLSTTNLSSTTVAAHQAAVRQSSSSSGLTPEQIQAHQALLGNH